MIKKCSVLLYALPGVLTGIAVMCISDVAWTVSVQNLICFILCGIAAVLYLSVNRNVGPGYTNILTVLCLLFLCCPFVFAGMDGVHRWVRLGPVSLHAAFISLPLMLAALNRRFQSGSVKICCVLAVLTGTILFLQPDASVLTAFSAALIPMLRTAKDRNRIYGILSAVLLLSLSVIAWICMKPLAPVPYVEGILGLAAEKSPLYLAACVLSLLALLWPFAKNIRSAECGSVSAALGLFWAILILSPLCGEFPVPVIGYGASPIIGYVISVSYIEKNGNVCR